MLCPRLSPVLHRRRLLGMPRGIPAGRGAAGARGTPRRGAGGGAPRRGMPRGFATRGMRGLAGLGTCLGKFRLVFSSRVFISHSELGPIEDFIARPISSESGVGTSDPLGSSIKPVIKAALEVRWWHSDALRQRSTSVAFVTAATRAVGCLAADMVKRGEDLYPGSL